MSHREGLFPLGTVLFRKGSGAWAVALAQREPAPQGSPGASPTHTLPHPSPRFPVWN